MILFLDFDGVLHPTYSIKSEFFCYLPRLESVLRDFPALNVVISSDWRRNNSLQDLREFFSEDLQPRIVGMTPVIRPYVPGVRLLEAKAWMLSECYEGPWVALDDDTYCWSLDVPSFIPCSDGLVGREENELRAFLTGEGMRTGGSLDCAYPRKHTRGD
jgi:hypothetical protein